MSKLFFKTSILATVIVLTAVLAAGCSHSSDISQSKKATATPTVEVAPELSQADFDSALKQLEVRVDEFDGAVNIDVAKKHLFKSDSTSTSVNLTIRRPAGGLAYLLVINGVYFADDWMFHSSIDLKSDWGSYSVPVLASSRYEEVLDGGDVMEVSASGLTSLEPAIVCKTVAGSNLRVRIRGEGREVTYNAPTWMIRDLRSVCAVWKGMQQGLTSKLLPESK